MRRGRSMRCRAQGCGWLWLEAAATPVLFAREEEKGRSMDRMLPSAPCWGASIFRFCLRVRRKRGVIRLCVTFGFVQGIYLYDTGNGTPSGRSPAKKRHIIIMKKRLTTEGTICCRCEELYLPGWCVFIISKSSKKSAFIPRLPHRLFLLRPGSDAGFFF